MADSKIAGNIIQILAGLPEFLRKPMLKGRMSEFFTLDAAEKREIVESALAAAPDIDTKVLGQLVKTWMEVLCEFDEAKRRDIFAVYANVIADSQAVLAKLDADELIKIYSALPAEKQAILAGSLRSLIRDLPSQKKTNLLGAVPDNARRLLQL